MAYRKHEAESKAPLTMRLPIWSCAKLYQTMQRR
jgi:hypothetical protein